MVCLVVKHSGAVAPLNGLWFRTFSCCRHSTVAITIGSRWQDAYRYTLGGEGGGGGGGGDLSNPSLCSPQPMFAFVGCCCCNQQGVIGVYFVLWTPAAFCFLLFPFFFAAACCIFVPLAAMCYVMRCVGWFVLV